MPSNAYDGMIPSKCLYFILCLNFLPSIIGLSSLLTYISLGVHYLVQDYNIKNLCPESYLWEYVLLSVIFSPLFFIHYFLKQKTRVTLERRFKVLIISVILYLAIVFLGGYGLYDHSLACENDNTDLWKFGISSFILQLLYLFYCFIYYLDYILPEPTTPDPPSTPSSELESEVFIEDPPYINQVSVI